MYVDLIIHVCRATVSQYKGTQSSLHHKRWICANIELNSRILFEKNSALLYPILHCHFLLVNVIKSLSPNTFFCNNPAFSLEVINGLQAEMGTTMHTSIFFKEHSTVRFNVASFVMETILKSTFVLIKSFSTNM